jgi:hypothetical protein
VSVVVDWCAYAGGATGGNAIVRGTIAQTWRVISPRDVIGLIIKRRREAHGYTRKDKLTTDNANLS